MECLIVAMGSNSIKLLRIKILLATVPFFSPWEKPQCHFSPLGESITPVFSFPTPFSLTTTLSFDPCCFSFYWNPCVSQSNQPNKTQFCSLPYQTAQQGGGRRVSRVTSLPGEWLLDLLPVVPPSSFLPEQVLGCSQWLIWVISFLLPMTCWPYIIPMKVIRID